MPANECCCLLSTDIPLIPGLVKGTVYPWMRCGNKFRPQTHISSSRSEVFPSKHHRTASIDGTRRSRTITARVLVNFPEDRLSDSWESDAPDNDTREPAPARAGVRLGHRKAVGSGFVGRAVQCFRRPIRSVAIEFRCGGPRRGGRLCSAHRESGECQSSR
jgi:hypothetical protein